MPVGLEVTNANGIIQIDGQNINPCLQSKGTAYTSADSPRNYESVASRVDIPIPSGFGDPTFLAIRPAPGPYLGGSVCPFGNGEGSTRRFLTDLQPGHAIEWWFFARPAVISSAGFGLDIHNSSGELVYSMGMKPMRIVDVVPLPGANVYHNSLGKLAVAFGSYAGGWTWIAKSGGGLEIPDDNNPGSDTFYVQQGYGIGVGDDGSYLQFNPMMHSDASTATMGDPSPGTDTEYTSTALVLDVTGY